MRPEKTVAQHRTDYYEPPSVSSTILEPLSRLVRVEASCMIKMEKASHFTEALAETLDGELEVAVYQAIRDTFLKHGLHRPQIMDITADYQPLEED